MTRTTRLILLACATTLACGGCALPTPWFAADTPAAPTTAAARDTPRVRIAYETSSDRLNIASGSSPEPYAMTAPAGRPVSYPSANGHAAPRSAALPGVTQSRLEIIQPHPERRPGMAMVVLRVSAPRAPNGSVGAWRLDVPAWQVDAIVEKLREERFFRSSRVLGSEATVRVNHEGREFAKRFRALPELDAMALRAYREGRPLHDAQQPARPRPPAASRPPSFAGMPPNGR